MKGIDRADFTNNDPYKDCPQYLGFQATISAPHMHVAALVINFIFINNSEIIYNSCTFNF